MGGGLQKNEMLTFSKKSDKKNRAFFQKPYLVTIWRKLKL